MVDLFGFFCGADRGIAGYSYLSLEEQRMDAEEDLRAEGPPCRCGQENPETGEFLECAVHPEGGE